MERPWRIAGAATIVLFCLSGTTDCEQKPSPQEVLDAMRKASAFMADSVSTSGGYLYTYTEDMAERWGEVPARPSQVWVQSGTPLMGMTFLDAYRITGDRVFLSDAKAVANALIYGQHPLGGWHYVIDFDMPGIREWYRTTASQYRNGMEEHRHFYGNCTFDDNTTQGATMFLMDLYLETLDPAYRGPLLTALDFILMAQYPNGAWPQRYPLRYEFAHDGLPDYTANYTLNDSAMRNTLNTLIAAWERLGDTRCLDAALRGIDFIILAQGPAHQPAWAEQYDMAVRPAWGRTHEPPSVMPRVTSECIEILERFYLMTGDRRYLEPIPGALRWFEESTLEVMPDGRHKFARFYTPDTNLPIYKHWTGEVNAEGYETFYYDQDHTGNTGSWAGVYHDVDAYRREYERIIALSPYEARAEYAARQAPRAPGAGNPKRVATVIAALNDRGAWVEELNVHDHTKTMLPGEGAKTIRGISTETFRDNMGILMNYYANIK